MKKRTNRLVGVFLLFLLLLSITGCRKTQQQSKTQAQEVDSEILYTIGVVLHSPDDPEMRMFRNYYAEYLTAGFPVKFYFSEQISSGEQENEFIRSMKEQGAQGIISFYGQDVRSTVSVCEEEELYYVLGSGTLSDEDFDAVKDSPWFLGTVGPDPEEEYRAGREMAAYFAKQDMKSYLILTGGSKEGNFMHYARSQGILEGLEEEAGLDFGEDISELALTEELRMLDTGKEGITVTLSPGYMEHEDGMNNVKKALEIGNYDGVLCSYSLNLCMDLIIEKEKEQSSDIQLGTVDCFSENNFEAVKASDAFGNPKINYIEGKYASMAGPAFAMLYNAMSGHKEANAPKGETVRLYQGFWKSESREEFVELYGYTQGIYENAYSCKDLMQVIKVFNEETTPENLAELTKAYKVEDVKARILEQ